MVQFDSLTLHQALTVLGEVLSDRDLDFEVVAIGGGGLLLLGMISRPTKDVDLVALNEHLPVEGFASNLSEALAVLGA